MSNFLINNHKIVFIHIPKSAGTSIRKGFFNGNYTGPVMGHIPKEWESYFKFAFVRNPYERFVSAYKMFKKNKSDMSIKEFYDITVNEKISYNDRETLKSKIRHHTIPQLHPYNCLQFADFIGRYENLEKDFKFVCEKNNIPFTNLPHLNKTKNDDYRSYYNDELKQLVYEYYREDLETFNYEF